ncbi:hypothetical protein [Nocardioides sp.]|uniref:hypothetical protein n=1 Tax=Nocardioides sp. TaxID=35761 RepID=UPI002728CA4F|nr:hypothetical protein [Nocardioides sp.]MDO9458466.1 hypothetical protein [Nocardioides sp.]
MTSLAAVAALLARYDDDAWVALANRGLLRRARKDLGSVSPVVVDDGDEAVVVSLGERTVRVPLAGPAEATCDCPSPVTCQHVLAAGLWLAEQDRAFAGAGEEAREGALHAELMALDAAALTAYAGKPGLRWAHQQVADLFAGEEPPRVERGGYLAVTFGRPEVVARYPGGGLDGLVLDQKVTQPKKWKVAAVLAWQRAHGLVLDAPAPAARSTGPTERGLSRDDSRARLHASVRALLEDLVRVGVSHLSPATLDRLTTAATWAQGAEYPRLALLLRRLADQVDLALGRDASADDHVLLDEAAVAYGLVSALEAAAARGESPVHLVGRARTSYDAVRSLDLVGLGGQPWRTASGYHGLTCVFWSPERRRVYTWGDTRPEDVGGFDPRARWTQPAPWKGLAMPATTSGRRLVLTGAQVSADGRLSGVEATSALVTPTDSDDLLDVLPAVSRWADLDGGSGPRSLLAGGNRSAAWAVLRPSAVGKAVFDPARQTLVWPVLDGDGEVVSLELVWSRLLAHAIARVESLGALPEGALVVARVRRLRGAWVGDPLSIVRPGRELNPVDALHFDGEATSPLVGRLLGSAVPDRAPAAEVDDGAPPAGLPPALVALRSLLEQQAQRGCAGAPAASVRERVGEAHRALRDVGWPVFATPDPAVDPAVLLLRSHYVLQQVERTFR